MTITLPSTMREFLSMLAGIRKSVLRRIYRMRLKDIRANRMYLIQEVHATHKMLDDQEQVTLRKLEELEAE